MGLREGDFWKFKVRPPRFILRVVIWGIHRACFCSARTSMGLAKSTNTGRRELVASRCGTDFYSDSFHRTPSWTDRVLYTTYSDDPQTPEISNITNLLYTSVPGYTTSDHVKLFPLCHTLPISDCGSVVQKPVVSLLLLPPPLSGSEPSVERDSEIPVLKLPPDFKPALVPYASLKCTIGRILDRILGYVLSILTLLGAGSTVIGVGSFVLGMGVLTFWRKNTGTTSDV